MAHEPWESYQRSSLQFTMPATYKSIRELTVIHRAVSLGFVTRRKHLVRFVYEGYVYTRTARVAVVICWVWICSHAVSFNYTGPFIR